MPDFAAPSRPADRLGNDPFRSPFLTPGTRDRVQGARPPPGAAMDQWRKASCPSIPLDRFIGRSSIAASAPGFEPIANGWPSRGNALIGKNITGDSRFQVLEIPTPDC